MKTFAHVVAISCWAATAVAKPLYITVPKSYGTTEPAVVDLAFVGAAPVELRVLKPRDLDRYMREQANLRRAYTLPATTLNPGRYLSAGLNAIDNPGDFLLHAMSVDFRKAVAPALPARKQPTQKVSRLNEGAKKLVGVPAGMEVVRSEWLNLDLGGADRGFDVPGFEWWSGSSGFQERRVALKPLPAGVYVLQLVQEQVEGQVTLVVTDLTVQAKQTDGEVLVRVAGRDQKPRRGATVKILAAGGKGPQGTTNDKGEVRLKSDEPRLLMAIADRADVALVDTDFFSSLAVATDVFIYSDRPIYKPGDELRFRGVVRKPASYLAQLFAPKNRQVKIQLKNRENADVSATAAVDEFGCFAGKLDVPESLSTGVVQLVASLDDQAHQSEARVQAYVKPTFYVELESDADSVSPGTKIKAKVRARRYAGGVPDGARYEVYLYRSVLDTPAWVDDAALGGEGSAVTYGSVPTTEGKLSVPLRLYSSVEERQGKGGDFDVYDPWKTAPTFDAKGEATIVVEVPELSADDKKARLPFKYTLTVGAQDAEATTASVSKTLFYAECDVVPQVSMSHRFVTQGDEAVLSVRAATLAGRVFGASKGEVVYELHHADGGTSNLGSKAFSTGEDGVWRDKAPTSKVGSVVAQVTLKDKRDRARTEQTKLLVIGLKGEPVARVPLLTAEALPLPLGPGDKARLIALFPEGWGPGGKNSGPVWLTLSSSSIFDTSVKNVDGSSGIFEFPIERRFGSAVYASVAYPTGSGRWEERTVAFRIIPAERTLSVRVEPQKPEVQPLTEQTVRIKVTDYRGSGVEAQVSLGVVDKAIYALQTEFRPRILDFFYPLIRNNVANFYSGEFQGYGYGEYLARLRSRARAFEFAAVKPPKIKQRDEDTAYWNPRIVTDASGVADVTFKLPGNSTLWVATAVAADASGRFGESTAEFQSRADLMLVASLPQFLRAGDRAQGSVRVASAKKASTLDLHVEASGALKADSFARGVEVAAKGEQVVPVALVAGESGRGRVSLRMTSDGDMRTAGRDVRVEPAAVRQVLSASAYGGGDLELEVPKGAEVVRVELNLMPSSVAASLASVRNLLDYPYGCIEQLVATTIPNVAVYSTLKKVDAFGRLDPESQALLEESYSRSVQGVQRIMQLATKSGGFTWFGGYSEASLPLTLIAVDGLTYAADAGLIKRGDPRLAAAASYLTKQDDLPFALDATRSYVLARLEGKKHAPRVRALLEKASGGDMYAVALATLAAHEAGVMSEPGVEARVQALAEEAGRGIAKVADYRLEDAFWRYPLSRIGLTAILGHAASFAKLDRAEARKRFVTAMATAEQLSTFDQSTVLLHNLWLIEEDAKAMREMKPPEVDAKGGAKLVPRGAGLAATLSTAATEVEVGSFDGIATLKAEVLVPLDKVEAKEQGMKLARRYWLLRPDGREPLKEGSSVAQGQFVFVELEVDAHDDDWRQSRRSSYYVIEEAIPAGFEPVSEDKRFRSAPYALPLSHEALKYRSLNPDRAQFFFEEPTWWSRSPRSVGYVMRAQFPGTFSIPPAKVSDMYAPQIMAQTKAASLTIAAK